MALVIEETIWSEVCTGDTILGADGQPWIVEHRDGWGRRVTMRRPGASEPRTGAPDPDAPARRLARGEYSTAVDVLRAGGLAPEILAYDLPAPRGAAMHETTEVQGMAGDQFGEPAPQGKKGEYVDEHGTRRDRWDRPWLPDPVTGEWGWHTRASTLGKALEDSYMLDQYQQRMVAKGMSLRPDLVALAAATELEEKKKLQDIAKRAAEHAGNTARRDIGTALHKFTQNHDHGTAQVVPPELRRDVDEYARTMRAYGLVTIATEKLVCVPGIGAGSLDKLVRCEEDGMCRILDVKTGDNIELGALSFLVQLAIYTFGAYRHGYWDAATQKWVPFGVPIDPYKAYVMHLPPGGVGEIYEVDTTWGAQQAARAVQVREIRKEAKTHLVKKAPLPVPSLPAAQLVADMAAQGAGMVRPASVQAVIELAPVCICDPTAQVYCHAQNCQGGAALPDGTMHPDGTFTPAAVQGTTPAPLGIRSGLINVIRTAQSTTHLMQLRETNADIWDDEANRAASARWVELTQGVAA